MKELSIQEKATRYDEALARANEMIKSMTNIGGVAKVDDIQHIFPELKESEDERISGNIIATIHLYYGEPLEDEAKEMIAWLEKQGEQKIKTPEESLGIDSDTYNKIVDECIYGEQKHTDKVESNFNVGDWVVYCNDDVDLITGIEENGYCINNSGYIPFICSSDIRLWTIQDAKDGDVLAWDDSKCIALFKNIYDEDSFNSYGFVGGCTGTFESRQSYHDIEGAHPATKEQRYLLFQKMHEAGYEWDAEKKELIKIEQKPAALSEEDVKALNRISTILVDASEVKNWWKEYRLIERDEMIRLNDFLKSLIDRYTWKPSDEQIEALESATENCAYSEYQGCLRELIEQLKKLKE